MAKFINVFFIVLAANLLNFGLGFLTYEFFVGLLLMFYKSHCETGAVLLAGVGVPH